MSSSSIHPFSASYKSHSSQLPSFSIDHYSSSAHLEKLIKSSNSTHEPFTSTSTHHHQSINKSKSHHPSQASHLFNPRLRPNSIFFSTPSIKLKNPSEEFITSQTHDSYRINNAIDKAMARRDLVIDLDNQGLSTIPNCIKKLELLTSTPKLEKPHHPTSTSRHRTLNRVSSAPASVFNSYTANQFTGLNLILSNNHLTDLKPLVHNLKSIQSLSLRSNQIKIIPEEIQELKQLKHLNLSNNQIEVLPFSILNLIQSNPCHLLISGNPLLKKPNQTLQHEALHPKRIISIPTHDDLETQTLQKSCIRRICLKEDSEERVLKQKSLLFRFEDLNDQINLSPHLIHQILNPIQSFSKCDECEIWKNQDLVKCIEWIQSIEINQDLIPIQYKFCHQICLINHFSSTHSSFQKP
ncbi:hypothetical protein DFH28DRAFT_259717 [Melampsora americana]|nr:hypothetical protein DFH28DRAFT_259717 [Melampsora americana]